jgi:hypothetical protein
VNRRQVFALPLASFVPLSRAGVLDWVRNPGTFQRFVDEGRLDAEVAHVLHLMSTYPPATWVRHMSAFAYRELVDRNLVAMVRSSGAPKIAPLLRALAASTWKLWETTARTGPGGVDGLTIEVGSPGAVKCYTLLRDDHVIAGPSPARPQGFFARLLAHELTRMRNREVIVALRSASASTDLFVDPSAALASGGGAQMMAAEFVAELIANHVEWRVMRDIEQRWDRIPAPIGPKRFGIWNFALELADNFEDASGGYLRELQSSSISNAFNRQVALWIRHAALYGLFHDDSTMNTAVRSLFAAAVSAAAPAFARTERPVDGGETAWRR